MNSIQYEELCRLFIADKFKLSIEEVQSDRILNPRRPDSPEYRHQIDLRWEDGNELTENKYIANAKWRSSAKIDQGDVLLLQKVKEKVAANKAVMITNIGFTEGAEAVAKDEGIALHIVRPDFDIAILDPDLKDRTVIQAQFQKLSTNDKSPYTYEIVHRAVDSGTDAETQSGVPNETVSHSKVIRQTPVNRMARPTSDRRAPSGTQKVQGGQSGSPTGGRGGSGKKGPGPARGGGRAPRRR